MRTLVEADEDIEMKEEENVQEQSCSLETWQQSYLIVEVGDGLETEQDGTGILVLALQNIKYLKYCL